MSTLKLLNGTAYNKLIFAQEDTIFVRSLNNQKQNRYGDIIEAWIKI